MENQETYSDDFRGHLSTVDEKGKRIWVYPKAVKGKLYKYRTLVSYLLLAVLFGLPHLYLHGEPLLLFNIMERKFIIFGQIFWPQDFHIFLFAMIAFILFIILFTVVFGRIFCGWICPQTIFLEMVFRKIERWIEGDHIAQKKLNKQKWNSDKILKKTFKHVVFFGISYLVANTFLAYIIGKNELIKIQLDNPAEHIGGLVTITIFSFAFYGVFAFLREQVCTNICPYGRFQGVMLDSNTIVVGYDSKRGEPREKNTKLRSSSAGDCIDCKQCVVVCPTGIDIRNGTQLECVNCTACIDACDEVMLNINKPTNLIKYASENQISKGLPFEFTARMKAYTGFLALILVILAVMIFVRGEVETSVLRSRGQMFTVMTDGRISNLYKYKIVNKTNEEVPIHFNLLDIKGEIEIIGTKEIMLQPEQKIEGILMIKIDTLQIQKRTTPLRLEVMTKERKLEEVATVFMAPRHHKNKIKH
ncbi:MAG: cytochrome c oxidase accessory protein CcoG [Bacteroidetes bacterium]|nr:cytochrome c oxidase accessory protein CcoG [Bacteroidota bacterium]